MEVERKQHELQQRLEIARLEAENDVLVAESEARIAKLEVQMTEENLFDVIKEYPEDDEVNIIRDSLPLHSYFEDFQYQPKTPISSSLEPQTSLFTAIPEHPPVNHSSPIYTVNATEPGPTKDTPPVQDHPRPSYTVNVTDSGATETILTKMVKTLERISLSHDLPRLQIARFDGTPDNFPTFRLRFHQMIETKPLDDQVKMATLLQFLEGPALRAAKPYETLPGGFAKALDVLETRFGRPCQVVRACVDKLTKGPQISAWDREALQSLADNAEATHAALLSMSCLQEMNIDNLERIILRLLKSLQTSFGEYLRKIEQGGQTMPTFKNVVDFLKQKALVANHPFFTSTSRESPAAPGKFIPKPRTTVYKATTMSTTNEIPPEKARQRESTYSSSANYQTSQRCAMCSEPHPGPSTGVMFSSRSQWKSVANL